MFGKLLSVFGIALVPGVLFAQKVDNSTVDSFSLGRFLGTWYEIARFDHPFERGMDFTTARYSMEDDGNVRVTNTGVRRNRLKTSVGRAKLTETPGLLRVSFFWPFYSDYRVLMVTGDYQYALIGGKSGKYLWVLSRQSSPDDAIVDMLLSDACSRGYDVSRLVWVQH